MCVHADLKRVGSGVCDGYWLWRVVCVVGYGGGSGVCCGLW